MVSGDTVQCAGGALGERRRKRAQEGAKARGGKRRISSPLSGIFS